MSPERQRARRRAALWLLLAVAVLLGALVALFRSRRAEPPFPALVEPLSLVPAGPAFVLTVDVARLRTTELGRKLVGRELARLAPQKNRPPWDDCRPQLSSEVDRLAVSMPPMDATGDHSTASGTTLGVVAAGRFTKNRVMLCVLDSGLGFDAFARARIGSFETRRDPHTTREVAARDGLVVVSDGAYFRALLDRAELESARTTKTEETRDKVHAELRRLVGHNAPIVASLVLSHGWLPAVLGDPAAAASPLADIRAAAFRLELTSTYAVAGTLVCETDEQAARLEHLFTTLRTDLGALNAGAAALLAKLTLVRDGLALNFSGSLDLADLDRVTSLASPAASSTK